MNFTLSSIFVGIDVHKYTHTAIAIDSFGQIKSSCTFSNTTLDQFLAWLSDLSDIPNLFVGVEDINGYGYHVGRCLVASGYQTFYVPPVLTEGERQKSSHRAKTDTLDATRVAKVMLTKSEQTLPAKPIIQQGSVIRDLTLLLQEREILVKNQTALKNQLHALLHQQYGDTYKQAFKDCFTNQAKEWYQNDLKGIEHPLSSSIQRRLTQLGLIQNQLKEIDKQLKTAIKDHPGIQKLMASLPGCGQDSACKIVAEIGTIKRFATKEKLARYAGIAPVDRSSGKRQRLYTDHGGNRRLNRAIHQVALSQIGKYGPDYAKDYHGKKQEEGKTKLWSMRCLKRHLCNRIYTLLKSVS
jgi:transposase